MNTKTIMVKDLGMEHIGRVVMFDGTLYTRGGWIAPVVGRLASFQLLDEGERGAALIRLAHDPDVWRTEEGTITVEVPQEEVKKTEFELHYGKSQEAAVEERVRMAENTARLRREGQDEARYLRDRTPSQEEGRIRRPIVEPGDVK